jgi:hypothetical protein
MEKLAPSVPLVMPSLKLVPAQLAKILDVLLVMLLEPPNAHLARWVIGWPTNNALHVLTAKPP